MKGTIAQIWGRIDPPPGVENYPGAGVGGDISTFISNLLKTLIIGAGIYGVFNLILAGYNFLSAGGDPKKIEGAWAKIWQTLIGLAVAAGAFVIAAIIGQIIFGDATALLRVRVFGP